MTSRTPRSPWLALLPAIPLLFALTPVALWGAGGALPTTCIIDGIVFEVCPLGEDPLVPDGPGGGLLGLAPDLGARGGGFILVPSQIAPGQQFTANAVIENFGGLHYSPTAIRVDFYLSPLGEDALLPQNFLGSTAIVFPVVTSATLGEVGVLVSRVGQLPAITPGQYRLAIDVDVDDALEELSELNNAIAAGETITVGGDPDLVPQLAGFNLSAPVVQGGTVTIGSTVRNAGSGGIAGPASLAVRYRAVPEGGDELGGTVLGETTVSVPGGTAFAAGTSRAVPLLEVPVGLPPGEYQVAVDVDFVGPGEPAPGAIPEVDESNNSRLLGPMIVQAAAALPFPDYELEVARVALQEGNPLGVGHRLFIDVKLKDPGANVLPHLFPPIRVVASQNHVIELTDTTLRDFPQVSDFNGRNILVEPVQLIVPWPVGIPPGGYFVGAIIDPENRIPEEPDKSNNTALVTRVITESLCPRLPTLGQAEAVFDEIFTESATLTLPFLVDGTYCEGSLDADFDFFLPRGDACYMVVAYLLAREHVEYELLPAMQRACVTTLAGLLAASRSDVSQARLAAKRLKADLARFKQLCDGEPAAALRRRYCACSDPGYLSWAPPPGPGQCAYLPHIVSPELP